MRLDIYRNWASIITLQCGARQHYFREISKKHMNSNCEVSQNFYDQLGKVIRPNPGEKFGTKFVMQNEFVQ